MPLTAIHAKKHTSVRKHARVNQVSSRSHDPPFYQLLVFLFDLVGESLIDGKLFRSD